MARDFKSSVIFPTVTGTTSLFGVDNTTTANVQQVFRTGLNKFSILGAGATSSTAFTAQTSDFFFVDEQNADQLMINTLLDGTKGDGMASGSAPLGIKNSTAPTSVSTTTGLWTYAAAHNLVDGQLVVFSTLTGGGGAFAAFVPYTVVYVSSLTFYLAPRWSRIPIVPSANVTAATYYATHPVYGLGPNSVTGVAGANPEPLASQYVRPLYLRCVLQPTNMVYAATTAAVSLQNLTVTVTGSYVRGFSGTSGTVADLDSGPYTTVTSKTFNQIFADGVTPANGKGLIGSIPLQTDYPFLRFAISVGRTETSTTGNFATTGTLSTIGFGMSLVTGRENALA